MGGNAVQGVPDIVAALRGQPCGLVEDEEAVVLVQHAGLQLTGNCSALGVKLPTCMQAQGFVAFLVAAGSSAAPTQSVAGWVGAVHRLGQASENASCRCHLLLHGVPQAACKSQDCSLLCSLSWRACLTSREGKLPMSDHLPCSHLLWCGGLCTYLQHPPPPSAQAAARPLPMGLFWSRFLRCHLLG